MVNIESEKIICQEFVGQFSSAVYFITEWEVITATTQNISSRQTAGRARPEKREN